jgi:hypothetical protein
VQLNPSFSYAFGNRGVAFARKGDYLSAVADYGHWLWLRFGILGLMIRLFLLAFALGFGFNQFRKKTMRSELPPLVN